jgi:hypothetical protein
MADLKLKVESPMEQVFLTYLTANASEVLATKINAGVKTLAGAVKYITDQARKVKTGEIAMVDDATVYGWLIHYFEDDSIAEPVIRKAGPKVPAGVKVVSPAPKKLDPQLGLFDNLTGGTPSAKTEPAGVGAGSELVSEEPEIEPDFDKAGESDDVPEDPDHAEC